MSSARPMDETAQGNGTSMLPEDPRTQTPEDEQPINILLVDDEPRNLTVLQTILDDPGYRLVGANSANEALLALVQMEFALIVLDIQMPDMNGIELAHMIKERRRTASIPIIFLTAHFSEDQHVLEGYETGAVDYLMKPVNSTILRSKVAVFAELDRKNRASLLTQQALSAEVRERRQVQEQLRQLNLDLEHRVEERTQELSKAQLELKEADRRKDQFLAMLGHELRNPLAPIRNAVSILEYVGAENPDLRWCHEVLDRQVTHLTRLVDDLLDVSRVSRGKIQLQIERVDLGFAVQAAVEACLPLITSRNHELKLALSETPIFVEGDSVRLSQIVANLLNNAAKYTDDGGMIQVTLERSSQDPNQAIISVVDNGRGINPESIESLFELFYQADRNLDRSDGGLGIGLSLVRSLVEMHHGKITAHSSGTGHGSQFQVFLPCIAAASDVVKSEPLKLDHSTGGNRKLLIVDDNCDSARSLGMLLKSMGFEVLLAFDGREGVQVAVRERPEIILLDIGLPQLNGYEACREIRNSGLTSQLIVAITGYGLDDDRKLSHEAGFNQHLVKPVNMTDLTKLLSERSPAVTHCN